MEELLEKYILVKDSYIHGFGLFTEKGINAGEKIVVISGEVISADECEQREEKGNVYIFWNGDSYIDTSFSEKIKYINHNCGCNCFVKGRDEFTLYLAAKVDIPAGEELTIDYGYDEIYELCRCTECAA